jgi:hypothetical protein
MEDVGIFYVHLVFFTAIWYILWILCSFGIIFSRFGILYEERSGNPEIHHRTFPRLSCGCHLTTDLSENRQLQATLGLQPDGCR